MARNTNAAAARTRRTAARVRTCAKARFLPIRRRVFICFLAEVGVLIPYTFPTTQFANVTKKRSSPLALHFCNVAERETRQFSKNRNGFEKGNFVYNDTATTEK